MDEEEEVEDEEEILDEYQKYVSNWTAFSTPASSSSGSLWAAETASHPVS